MNKGIVSFFLIILLFVGTSIRTFAITSEAPLLILTEQEKEYFSQLQSLRVITVPNIQPYAYGNMGVSIDILESLCASADVELQLIEADSYSDALIRLENGEAELAAVRIATNEDEDKGNILPYLDAPLQSVRHKQVIPSKQSSLSIAQIEGLDFSYDKKYAFVNTVSFPAVWDCLDSVRGRQTDIFLCDIYQLSVFSESFAARDLTMTTLPRHEVSVGFGLTENTDPRFISALQSTVDSFSTSELSKSLTRHMQYHNVEFSVLQFVYQNPFELLCAVTSLFFVILLCVFVFFRIRASQRQELKGYEESYRMLADTFGEAGLEYDFLSDRFTVFGGNKDRIDLPEVVEQVHVQLEQGTLRISLTSEDLDKMLQNNTMDHSYQVELQCGMKEGSWNWFKLIYIVVCTSESHRRPIRLIGCLVNIEEERREKEQLLKISCHDKLTGLLNRASGEKEIMQELDVHEDEKVLLFLDIDYFKSFNDFHGHSCGDAVLSELGESLLEVFSQEDILCRWGGDEFILLIKGKNAQEENLYACLRQLQERMRAFTYIGQPLPVTLSIGGTTVSKNLSFQSIFESTDEVLYQVKNEGRDHFRVVFQTQDTDVPCREEKE